MSIGINWESFNPEKYVSDNYAYIHGEDKQILDLLIDFYRNKHFSEALEVGVGPNLYPIMAMLPFVDKLECIEYAQRNINYLLNQIASPSNNWKEFQKYLIAKDQRYNINLGEQLGLKVLVKQGSIYDLPENKYDLVSMNFVAESISDKKPDFVYACNKFVEAAKTGGILVASFMENSSGYEIDGIKFPAYSMNEEKLKIVFEALVTELKIYHIKPAKVRLRPGYSGMLLLTAKRKQKAN